MKTVEIISGVYGADNGKGGVTTIARGQICEVSDVEAARLVSLGVAAMTVATPQEGQGTAKAGENTPESFDVAEGQETAQDGLALNDCIDIVDGHMTEKSLMHMTRANMEALAADLCIDVAKCKNKAEIAALLTQVDLDLAAQADEELPVIGAAMPE